MKGVLNFDLVLSTERPRGDNFHILKRDAWQCWHLANVGGAVGFYDCVDAYFNTTFPRCRTLYAWIEA
jgi:hypothetical protein